MVKLGTCAACNAAVYQSPTGPAWTCAHKALGQAHVEQQPNQARNLGRTTAGARTLVRQP